MLNDLTRPKGYDGISLPFLISKPWGWEKLLELWEDPETGRGYCLKLIFLKSGEESSLQYHKRKVETQYVISGRAEVSLQNDYGSIEKKILGTGEFFTVITGRIHRVRALTDFLLLEASTPEIDDTIRVADNYDRKTTKDSRNIRAT